MKIVYNLDEIGVIDKGKTTIDWDGNYLSNMKINHILSFITNRYLYSHSESVEISSKSFANFNPEYKLYLNHLRRREVIFWGNYVVGEHARSFFFTDLFKSKVDIKKILIENKDKEEILYENVCADGMVNDQLKDDYYTLMCNDNAIRKQISGDYVNFKGYISSHINYQTIKNGKSYFTWKTGRLYTNFCQCSKDVRLNNFTFDGDSLFNLDIPSSHPMFLCLWLKNKGIENDFDYKEFCNDVYNKDKKGRSLIYNSIREKLNKMKDIYSKNDVAKPFFTRLKAKEQFFKWLNGKDRNDITNNLMKSYYPSIYDMVNRKDYKMYDEIVRMETNWIMNILVNRLYCSIPNIKIITCHDEIYFQKKYYIEVKRIWDDEINKIFAELPVTQYEYDYDYLKDFIEIG